MARFKWTDEQRYKLQRALFLYDNQIRLVHAIEFPDLSYSSVMNAATRLKDQGEIPFPDFIQLPLHAAMDPEGTAERILTEFLSPNGRIKLPAWFAEFDPAPPEIEIPEDEIPYAADQSYIYKDGEYIFAIDGKMYTISYERWNAVCRDYSSHGTDLTQAEVARRHGVPLPHLRRLLALYGQFKASAPASREAIHEHREDLTPLVKEALENDEFRFLESLTNERDLAWRKDYKKVKEERLSEDRMIENARVIMAGVVVPNPEPIECREGAKWEAHVPTADEHVGKYVWGAEAFGDNLDTDTSCGRLGHHSRAVSRWVMSQPGRCSTMHRSFLGDLFHALSGETDHGTSLDQDTRSARVWSMTIQAIVDSIVENLTVAEFVIVRFAKGNHDSFQIFQAMHCLAWAFKDNPRVTVDVDPSPFCAFRVADTLHVLDHGYRVSTLSWKAKAQAEVVAREQGGEDFKESDFIFTYIGDKHEWTGASHGRHHVIQRMPSLGESDDYETGLRYPSDPSAHAFRLDSRGRLGETKIVYREELEGRG